MEYLYVHVFKDSFHPMVELLNAHDLKYQIREQRSGAVMASSGVIEVLQTASIYAALAAVVVSFIKSRNGRKVIITTKDNEVIHAEGLNAKELEEIVKISKSLAAVDPNKDAE
jgi:hypothetical protein